MSKTQKALKCDMCGQIACICNEKYNLPCPYAPEVLCIQMPCSKYDDNLCDGGCPQKEKAANNLAQFFHETYEDLAPDFGYKTRKASAKPWGDVPEDNKNLMIAVAEEVYGYLGFYWLKAQLATAKEENERLKGEIEKWGEHNSKCKVNRFSALGCQCGLFKQEE